MTATHRDAAVVDACTAALEQLRDVTPSLVFASVITDDGFEVTHVGGAVVDVNRFGSMSSSVQALGDAVSRELRIGDTGYVVIAASKGHVLQLRVPGHPIILAAHFDDHELLGKALAVSRGCAERLAASLPTDSR